MADPVLLACVALPGAAAGSFLNVCISRTPAGESVVHPRSRCPACRTPIRWFDNLPVVSWVVLRARCRACAGRISFRYPAVELATAGIWVGMALAFGVSATALVGAVLFSLLLGIAITDARHYLIPNALSLGGLGAGLAASLLPGLVTPLAAVGGAALGFGLLFVAGWLGTKALGKPALGEGDVKMMAMVGAFLGPLDALLTIFLGALAGSVLFGPVSFRTGKPVPFGVFLALGAAVAFLFGDALIDAYLALAVSG